MCLIIYSPDGHIPRKHLQAGLRANSNGWGFMFPHNGSLHIHKGLHADDFWEKWSTRPQGTPVVWHARIRSHGKIDVDNCHPFPVPNHPGLAMVHNGIINTCSERGSVSDTRIFLDRIVGKLPDGFLHNSGIRRMMSHHIGGSKLVFMDAAGGVEFINEDLGHWYKKRWYSNESYKIKRPALVHRLPPAVNRGFQLFFDPDTGRLCCGPAAYDPESKGLLVVFEMPKQAYKAIPVAGITRLKINGVWHTITRS